MRQRSNAHLEADLGKAAKVLTHPQHLLRNVLRSADHQRAAGPAQRFKLRASYRGPATLTANLGESGGISGEEVCRRLFICIGDVAESVNAHLRSSGL